MAIRLHTLASGFLAGSLLGLGASAAYAVVNSDTTSFYSGPVSYENYSFGDSGDYAGTDLLRTIRYLTPAGEMGAKGKVYFSEGVLCSATVMKNNTAPNDHFRVGYDHGCGGYVYSRGATTTWNGSGYNTQNAKRTVNWLE